MNDKLFKLLSDNSESIKKLYEELVKEYPTLEESVKIEKKVVKKRTVKKKGDK